MARKLRLEYPGAVYHVINRGNCRRDVFLGGENEGGLRAVSVSGMGDGDPKGHFPSGAGRPAGSDGEEIYIST